MQITEQQEKVLNKVLIEWWTSHTGSTAVDNGGKFSIVDEPLEDKIKLAEILIKNGGRW